MRTHAAQQRTEVLLERFAGGTAGRSTADVPQPSMACRNATAHGAGRVPFGPAKRPARHPCRNGLHRVAYENKQRPCVAVKARRTSQTNVSRRIRSGSAVSSAASTRRAMAVSRIPSPAACSGNRGQCCLARLLLARAGRSGAALWLTARSCTTTPLTAKGSCTRRASQARAAAPAALRRPLARPNETSSTQILASGPCSGAQSQGVCAFVQQYACPDSAHSATFVSRTRLGEQSRQTARIVASMSGQGDAHPVQPDVNSACKEPANGVHTHVQSPRARQYTDKKTQTPAHITTASRNPYGVQQGQADVHTCVTRSMSRPPCNTSSPLCSPIQRRQQHRNQNNPVQP